MNEAEVHRTEAEVMSTTLSWREGLFGTRRGRVPVVYPQVRTSVPPRGVPRVPRPRQCNCRGRGTRTPDLDLDSVSVSVLGPYIPDTVSHVFKSQITSK